MRYAKLFMSIIIIILITGCTKEYKLYINDDSIVEKFHMEVNASSDYSYVLDGDFYPLHNDFEHKFKKSLKTKGNNKVLDLEYTYSPLQFLNANSFNQCFDEKKIIMDDSDYYIISLSKPNGCMFNEDYIINIITNNKVVSNNAKKKKGNRYIWYVKNDDRENFKLEIKIAKGTGKNNIIINSMIYIVPVIALVAILIVLLVLFKRRKSSNKF